jgi:ferredoxin
MAKVIVKDDSGKKIAGFTANGDDPLSTQAQENGAEIPVACGVGVCGACKCKVKKGAEFIDAEAFGDAQIPLEEDEVLTCLSGIKENAPEDAEIEIESENL